MCELIRNPEYFFHSVGHGKFSCKLLKVSKSRNQIMASSILSKNKQNSLSWIVRPNEHDQPNPTQPEFKPWGTNPTRLQGASKVQKISYVKNYNIFRQILNIWVKLKLKKNFDFCFPCLALPKDPQSFGILIRAVLILPKLYDCLMTELPKIATFSDRF